MIYVTIAHYGKYDESGKNIVYVGENKNKAMNQKEDGWIHSFTVECWQNEIKIKELFYSDGNWEITFDKIKDLESSIQRKQDEITKEQETLFAIKENIDSIE